jgi:ATP-dependent Lon protease
MKIESAIRALFDLEQTQKRIQSEVQRRMQQSQKDWLISEQIRLLQNELSHGDPSTDIDLLQEKLKAKNYSEEIQEKLNEEIARLRLMPPASPEYSQLHNYLEWFLALPYGVFSETDLNLRQVKKHLDERHFGLEKVKERILEYVSVLRLTKTERRAPVLCLVGPPGVGKTTLVASIAEAIGRQYVRVTLGGVRDEAEIRGHRRTYIGAMPGRFVQALRRAKCMNPVILLDEIDKMASDFRGDPASALLELLDPEQNRYFADHFMEVGLDFSRVLFIATANTEQDIPPALFDRLEVVRLPGYYKHEKIEIAEKHLLPEAATRSGVELGKNLSLSRELIEKIISDYTREAGVRELDRLLEKITRSRAKEIVLGKKIVPEVTEKLLTKYLGAPRFVNGKLPLPGRCGRITGLAWTSVGGEILNIECMLLSGRGRIALTGRLGDVMKESVQIALSLVRQRLKRYGVDPDIVRKTDIHIHVPEGAVPKDGPSAGIAMTLAILSAFTRIPVSPDIAFTGEVSLCGDLLPIGGLNEKSLAAKEAGVKTLYVPEGNGKDVLELPAPARKSLKIYQKKHIDEIVKELFPVPLKKA